MISQRVSSEKHYCEKQQYQVFGRHFGLLKDLELWLYKLEKFVGLL